MASPNLTTAPQPLGPLGVSAEPLGGLFGSADPLGDNTATPWAAPATLLRSADPPGNSAVLPNLSTSLRMSFI